MQVPVGRSLTVVVLLALGQGCNERARLEWKAERGDPVAMRELGKRLWAHGGPSDEVEEGVRWLKKAAEKGDIPAMYEYALIAGESPEALYWYRKGAEAGDRFCCVEMGKAYLLGKYGLSVDIRESDKWYAAAERAKKLQENAWRRK